MLIAFELTMPNVGSWNGKWTGAGRCYVRIINFTQKYGTSATAKEKVKDILKNSSYYYNFGDGWGANVSVREVKAGEAAKLRRKSVGFCGYEWMIDSILQYGEILNSRQREERVKT
jgi:hypothetical protein